MNPTIIDNGMSLYKGDALSVLQGMPDASADAVVTDPPYSSGGASTAARKADPAQKYQQSSTQRRFPALLGDNKDQRSFLAWAVLWLSECWRIARNGSPLLMFSDWRQLPVMTDAVQAAGWTWRGVVVWEKPSARPMRGQFRAQAEYVIFATKGRFARATDRCLPGVFRHSVEMARRVHLTAKPVPLMCELLEVTKPGGVVLDPFMGGASTGLACLETGRQFVGVELSGDYFQIAKQRLTDR
ncbi:DNA-methyltransferase [Humidesulfovibrio idahonensis]